MTSSTFRALAAAAGIDPDRFFPRARRASAIGFLVALSWFFLWSCVRPS